MTESSESNDDLKARVSNLESQINANASIARFARFLASLIGGSMIILIWNTCSRALDTEDQARLNGYRLTSVENQLNVKFSEVTAKIETIDRVGTQPRQAAENKITDLQQGYKALAAHVEEYFSRSTIWHEQTLKDMSDMREKLARIIDGKQSTNP